MHTAPLRYKWLKNDRNLKLLVVSYFNQVQRNKKYMAKEYLNVVKYLFH